MTINKWSLLIFKGRFNKFIYAKKGTTNSIRAN